MKNNIGTIAPEPQLRCAIYARSGRQRSATLETQERHCREAIVSKGLSVAEQFVRGEVTEKSISRRNQLNSLLAAAQERPLPFEYVVMEDTKCLSSSPGDVLKVCELLRYYGVNLYFVSQKLDSRDSNFNLLMTFCLMVDEQYRERLKLARLRARTGREAAGKSNG
jgi:DNA invertase Pin-like site-specific DNA recombinase